MEKKIWNSLWVRLMLALSGTAYAVLLMQTPSKLSFLLTGCLALALMLVLTMKTSFLEKVFAPKPVGVYIVAGIVSLSAVYTAKSTFYTCCSGWITKLFGLLQLPAQGLLLRLTPWAVAFAALPMAFGYFLWFVEFFRQLGKELWKTSDFVERMYLLWGGIFFAVLICMTFMCTQAFYGAFVNGHWYNFDLIYSSDSGFLVYEDVFRNVGASQNDLRQPLYGVFSMPFAQAAWLISKLLFFLPKGYITVLQIMQMCLYLISVVLMARMLKLEEIEKVLFLMLMSVTYPVLIFSLSAEQYLMAVFYLILMIYCHREKGVGSFGYIAATGSMLTTGIFFPLVTWDRSFPKFVKNTLKLCGAFFAVMILSGRLTTFLDIGTYIAGYAPYTGVDVPLISKLMQYVNFVAALIVAPASRADFTTYSHVSWQMLPVTGWNILGFAVLAVAILGVISNRKAPFTKICGVWMGFSFLLLGIIGWGTIDNGLMLYTLYFGWAYVAMVFQFVSRALNKVPPLKLAVMAALIVAVALVNVAALKDVLVFGTQFFPALR